MNCNRCIKVNIVVTATRLVYFIHLNATDFNTGIVETKKLARITAKDNGLTRYIGALGRVAGNFPEVFTTKAASPWTVAAKIGRTGAMGTLGGLAGYQLGGGYTGAAIGSVLGAGTGIVGQNIAARQFFCHLAER
jgi:hypothetical protein